MATCTINFPWQTEILILCVQKKIVKGKVNSKLFESMICHELFLAKSHVCYLVIYVTLLSFDLIGTCS